MPIDNNTTPLLLIIWNWIEFYGNNVHVIDRLPCNSHNAPVTAGSERLTGRLERTPTNTRSTKPNGWATCQARMSAAGNGVQSWQHAHFTLRHLLNYCSPISIHELQDFTGGGSVLAKEAVEYYIRKNLLIYRLHTILPRCTKLKRLWNTDKKWEINATLHTD